MVGFWVSLLRNYDLGINQVIDFMDFKMIPCPQIRVESTMKQCSICNSTERTLLMNNDKLQEGKESVKGDVRHDSTNKRDYLVV